MRGAHSGWAQVVEVRRLDVVVPLGTGLDTALIQGDVAATGIEGDFLLGDDVDFVFSAGDAQPVTGHQLQRVVLCLDTHWPLVGDQLDTQFAHKQA
ncbi:hypothetical protein D3C71_1518330 [compost metagenome]